MIWLTVRLNWLSLTEWLNKHWIIHLWIIAGYGNQSSTFKNQPRHSCPALSASTSSSTTWRSIRDWMLSMDPDQYPERSFGTKTAGQDFWVIGLIEVVSMWPKPLVFGSPKSCDAVTLWRCRAYALRNTRNSEEIIMKYISFSFSSNIDHVPWLQTAASVSDCTVLSSASDTKNKTQNLGSFLYVSNATNVPFNLLVMFMALLLSTVLFLFLTRCRPVLIFSCNSSM